jgi:hypothetical protein
MDYFVSGLLNDFVHEFSRHKKLADRAMAGLSDEAFFHAPGGSVNSVAIIAKHLGGNLISRWTNFLTTDGEKPDRNRDGEFKLVAGDTRVSLLAKWDKGWQTLFDSVGTLVDADLGRNVTIRGEAHTVQQAILRAATHSAYHVGQILYLCRLLSPDSPWLTVPPGESGSHRASYLRSGN